MVCQSHIKEEDRVVEYTIDGTILIWLESCVYIMDQRLATKLQKFSFYRPPQVTDATGGGILLLLKTYTLKSFCSGHLKLSKKYSLLYSLQLVAFFFSPVLQRRIKKTWNDSRTWKI